MSRELGAWAGDPLAGCTRSVAVGYEGMEPDQGETNTSERADALPKHRKYFADTHVPRNAFDAAVCELVPNRRLKMIAELFDGRANIETIRKWRAGTRTAPQWARALLASRLKERESFWFTLSAKLKQMPVGRGSDWARKNPAD